MSITTLALAKAHLRETSSLQDSAIAAYLDAAEALAEHHCNRPLPSPLPKSVQSGVLLLTESMYGTRDNPRPVSIEVDGPIAALFNAYKDWSFGSSGPAPSGAETDVFPILSGDSWSRQWIWKNEDGSAINVTGYTGTFELLTGDVVMFTKSLSIPDAVNGTFSVDLTATETASFTAGESWYRVRVTSSTGSVTTLDRKIVVIQ